MIHDMTDTPARHGDAAPPRKPARPSLRERVNALRNIPPVQREIWAQIPDEAKGRRLTSEEESEILGYGPAGI